MHKVIRKAFVYFEDDNGDDFEVTFNTEDGDDKAYSDYIVVKIGDDYYDTSPRKRPLVVDFLKLSWIGKSGYSPKTSGF
jgi:hypothetical protein